MVLGASETLGLLEPAGKEYPAQLQEILDTTGHCYEVLNAAVVGMSLPAIHYTWDHFWREFKPGIVVVYPSPVFYLGDKAPRPPNKASLSNKELDHWPELSFRPRLLFRAKELIVVPSVIQTRRVRRKIAQSVKMIPADSIWKQVPIDRLELFKSDLSSLVEDIRATGSTVVLVTHAHIFSDPITEDEQDLLQAWRSFTPRAEANVLVNFDLASAQATRNLTDSLGVKFVDAQKALSGKKEFFGDFVHFLPAGSAAMARLIATAITADAKQ